MFDNLLEIKGLGPLLRSPWPWRLIRLAGLVVLLAMTAYGWHHHAIPGVEVADPLMYTNFASYFFWVLWMMGVVFLALLMGRAWCTVCPLGWINGLISRIGLNRPLPVWLDNFVPVTLALVALQLAVYFLAIHRFPDYTAALLALMLLLALGAGLIFRKRSFCTLFCPAGAVFGLYARVAPFQLRVRDGEVCNACESKNCVSGAPLHKRLTLGSAVLTWQGRRSDCPADLVLARIEDSATCSLCLHCVQNCDNDNIVLGRRPWLADLGRAGLRPSETLFFLVLLGMVTANFSKVYVDLREVIFWAPQQAAVLLGWASGGYYLLTALWVALIFPLLLLLPGYLVLRLGELQFETLPAASSAPPAHSAAAPLRSGFWNTLGELALPLIPMVLAAHVVLAVVKLNAKGGYLPFVIADPSGVKSYLAINVMNTVAAPGVLIPLDILKWLALALLFGGYLLALAGARRAAASLGGRKVKTYLLASMVPVTLVAAIYASTLFTWLFIR